MVAFYLMHYDSTPLTETLSVLAVRSLQERPLELRKSARCPEESESHDG
jgi:hypothetical protein